MVGSRTRRRNIDSGRTHYNYLRSFIRDSHGTQIGKVSRAAKEIIKRVKIVRIPKAAHFDCVTSLCPRSTDSKLKKTASRTQRNNYRIQTAALYRFRSSPNRGHPIRATDVVRVKEILPDRDPAVLPPQMPDSPAAPLGGDYLHCLPVGLALCLSVDCPLTAVLPEPR